MTNIKNFILLLTISLLPFVAHAQLDNDHISYEGILSELSSSSKAPLSPTQNTDPFASIMLHGGVGLVSSYLNVGTKSSSLSGLLTGVEASFGIDLFSSYWLAEGSIRSFGSDQIAKDLHISLREFDLKLIHRNPLNQHMLMRFGTGLSARYMDASGPLIPEGRLMQTTPAMILMLGLQAYLTRGVSLGADLSYRNPLIEETIDRSSLDASLRLDAHF